MKRNLAFLLTLIVVLSGVGAIPLYNADNRNNVGGDIEEIEEVEGLSKEQAAEKISFLAPSR